MCHRSLHEILRHSRPVVLKPVLDTTSPAHFVCLPHLSLLIQLTSLLVETARPTNWCVRYRETWWYSWTSLRITSLEPLTSSSILAGLERLLWYIWLLPSNSTHPQPLGAGVHMVFLWHVGLAP